MRKRVLRISRKTSSTTKQKVDNNYNYPVFISDKTEFLKYQLKNVIVNYENKKYIYSKDSGEFIEILYRLGNTNEDGLCPMLDINLNRSNTYKVEDLEKLVELKKFTNGFTDHHAYYDHHNDKIILSNGYTIDFLEVDVNLYLFLLNNQLEKAGIITNRPFSSIEKFIFRLRKDIPFIVKYKYSVLKSGDEWIYYYKYAELLSKSIVGFKK